jgi:hypothetical protein
MSVIVRAIKAAPGLRHLCAFIDEKRQQRNWSIVHRVAARRSSLAIFTNIGLGDVSAAQQICGAFRRYCEKMGDPRIGKLVITAGAWPPHFTVERGDHNVYWWWSMGGRNDWLDEYLGKINVSPDIVACLSPWCNAYAQRLGCNTINLPLAAGNEFSPLQLNRDGVGYAGTKQHKDSKQVDHIVGPFAGTPGFEWVSDLPTIEAVASFYNRKQIVLGMTEEFQESAGMVNARVFEVLATGSPFLLHHHRAVSETLGVHYSYQSSSAEETKSIAQDIMTHYEHHLAIFAGYQKLIAREHTYFHRMVSLIRLLQRA